MERRSLIDILPWNDKILDYEIETIYPRPGSRNMSIAWNDKILDYEIETMCDSSHFYRRKADLKR